MSPLARKAASFIEKETLKNRIMNIEYSQSEAIPHFIIRYFLFDILRFVFKFSHRFIRAAASGQRTAGLITKETDNFLAKAPRLLIFLMVSFASFAPLREIN
ncbi:hypothetical protein D1AOALGA4SA_5652 [Olavius algarvensis Delta 1 endosymbiont]|nr:hypothetical protein D1AOALGA4SA_5652 [Olavius algarvensis Delta 1 endosymbiont]